ncbi:equilibrative nucleotide transporter 1-like [Magnolia sinica]|uniref:equilibrative nucleotide transporter 1-like n=1 Tax=Magnolia sinica TaxID=86752 RepID=UPI00265A2FA9|nr:equilibrative nucleotide transporter 1-like [Magnolia sinica]
MGLFIGNGADAPLLSSISPKIPKDTFHLAYIVHFIFGVGFLLPGNTFITAVDYFSYIYPGVNINRIFTAVKMVVCFITVVIVLGWARKSSSYLRINIGLALFVASLLTVPIIDLAYVKGRVGLYNGFYVTVAAVVVCGVANGLFESGVVGAAGELPERYMQASGAGLAASGVIVSVLRIITKAIYPHDASGLRSSANLYFGVSIVIMVICLICYNISNKLPVIQYYKDLKTKAQEEEEENDKPYLSKSPWKSSLWDVTRRVKWLAFARFLIFVVTFSIFPGHITEDVHSRILNDWYPILLIACESLFNLVGMSLPAFYLIKNENVVVTASLARLLFYPLFLGCWYGPAFLQTEIPTATLTCLLGITNGYLANVLLILPPKTVPIQHAEAAGIVMVVFSNLGLSVGSIASWLWII